TPADVKHDEDATVHRQFVLTYVQPGLAGLMDGSVSTLAPIFAAAFATQDTWQTFLVGLSASVVAGISMGFTKAALDRRASAGDLAVVMGGLGEA
ncbi:rubrerythrin family protein, partial [Rhizobium leguminosarum]